MADPSIEDVVINGFLDEEMSIIPEFPLSITGIGQKDKVRVDLAGSGNWGDARKRKNEKGEMESYKGKDNKKSHRGTDIIVNEGSSVSAPFSGTITKIGKWYTNPKDTTKYVQISSESGKHTFRFAYVDPDKELKEGDTIKKGMSFGKMKRPIDHPAWGKDTSDHVHVEAVEGSKWKSGSRVDPSTLLMITE